MILNVSVPKPKPRKRRQRSDAQETKDQIREALIMMEENGDRTTVTGISSFTGLSRKTVSKHLKEIKTSL